MRVFNICSKKEYEKDGEKKVKWYKVGFLKVADSGRQYIKLFHQPHTEFYVFDKDEPVGKIEVEAN
jgi:hypothetical protein